VIEMTEAELHFLVVGIVSGIGVFQFAQVMLLLSILWWIKR